MSDLTTEQVNAIKSCRFRTRNQTRTIAFMWTQDDAVKEVLIPEGEETFFSGTRFRRDSVTGIHEYEIKSSHSEVLELCA